MKKTFIILGVLLISMNCIATPIFTLTQKVNRYIYSDKNLNINEEFNLQTDEQIIALKIKAWPLTNNSMIKISVDDMVIHKENLQNESTTLIAIKVKANIKKALKIYSNSAFIETLKANLVSDQPTDDDFSNLGKQ